jgi:hypothetical protein
MSDRERWTVYPLLFLAIGLALRNNVEMQDDGHGSEAAVVRCKALEVMGPEGKPTVTITSSSKGDGLIETGNAEGELQARLGGNTTGATLELLDREGKFFLLVGHDGDQTGSFVGDTESGKILALPPVIRRAPKTPPRKATEEGNKSATPEKENAPEATATPTGPVNSDGSKQDAAAPGK